MKSLQFLLFLFLGMQTGFSQKVTEKDFKSIFNKYGVDGCFVLFNPANNEYIRYNEALCDTGYIPASTFKIPNAVIALEEGVIKDTNELFKWDGHAWPVETWNQDQTLKTAVKYSCVWFFVNIAEKIGIQKYQRYVDEFDYGNKVLHGPPTRFWLVGSFRISANQQTEFLKRFYNYELPGISGNSIDIVKDLIILEKTDQYKLSGKTGGGMLSDTEYVMWLVGYVEKNNVPCFFAMNFITDDYPGKSQARYDITKDILRELGLII